jgi:hypothetical protein
LYLKIRYYDLFWSFGRFFAKLSGHTENTKAFDRSDFSVELGEDLINQFRLYFSDETVKGQYVNVELQMLFIFLVPLLITYTTNFVHQWQTQLKYANFE